MSQPDENGDSPTPLMAYFSAVFSFLFVTCGAWIGLVVLIGFTPLGDPNVVPVSPTILAAGALFLSMSFGGLSAYSAFRSAKRRAVERAAQKAGTLPQLPPWRRGLVMYPSATLGCAALGAIIGGVSSRSPMDFSALVIIGAVLGSLSGFIGSAIWLTVLRDYFPIPIATAGKSPACPKCGEAVPVDAKICTMCGAQIGVSTP